MRESEAFTFPFFLAGAAQADAGQGFQTFLGNGLAAFTAAGLTVDTLRPFPVLSRTGALEGGFACEPFQFLRLIENVHSCPLYFNVKQGESLKTGQTFPREGRRFARKSFALQVVL